MGEKLPVNIEEDNANDSRALAFQMCTLLSAMYRKFVSWLQVSTKYHSQDGRLTFTALMLAMYSRTGILIDYVS